MDRDNKEPRPRLTGEKRGEPVVADSEAFTKNLSSDKARIVTTIAENIGVILWFDKHYLDRHSLGDENGKREGIGTDQVEKLVLLSVKHLLFYSACIPKFTFLNHSTAGRAVRVVCQRETAKGMLNVVIQAHLLALDKYEITVKTAMCEHDFAIAEGQYALEITSEDNSTLRFMAQRKLSDVYSI